MSQFFPLYFSVVKMFSVINRLIFKSEGRDAIL